MFNKSLEPLSTPRRVLVVRAGALGDTLMVTPLVRALYNSGAEVDFLCSAGGAELLQSNPYLSRILILHLRNVPFILSPEKRKLTAELSERQYQFAVLLESAPHYRDLLARANISDIREFSSHSFDPKLHSIVNNLRVGGFQDIDAEPLQMDLPVNADALQSASRLLAGLPRPLIGIHSGYGPKGKKAGQTNRLRGWSIEKFAAVAREIAGHGASIVLTGSSEDMETCEAIARDLPRDHTRIVAGQTDIAGLGGLIKNLDLLISVDSGPAHIAAAVGTPVIVLWGPGILNQTKPISTISPVSIVKVDVPCAPCYGTPLMRTCKRNICMELITPEEVIQRAIELLDKKRVAK